MPSPMHQFKNTFRLLTTLVLTLCALGIILIPGHLSIATSSLSKIAFIALGVTFYITGIINQAFIFIARNERTRKLLDVVILLCLGILVFLYFQANLLVDGTLLIALICGQLYVLISHANEDEEKNCRGDQKFASHGHNLSCSSRCGLYRQRPGTLLDIETIGERHPFL